MQIFRRASIAAAAGLAAMLLAAMPAIALAAEQGRALERAPGSGAVILYTVGAAVALVLLSTVGYLYRRVRDLDWEFQRPDAPAHHEGH